MRPPDAIAVEISAAAHARSGALLELASALVRIPSDGPDHTEAQVVEALEQASLELKLPAGRIVAAHPDRPNLLIDVPFDEPGPRILLTGHTDTKPAGRRAAWDTDPWSGAIRDGRLLGLGSGDMKAALAAMLHAAAILRTIARPPCGGLLLAFTADEEASGELGLRYVLESTDLALDGAIIGEPAGVTETFDQISLASRGFFGFSILVTGTQGHSGLSDIGSTVNPVVKLAEVVAGLQRQRPLADASHPLFPNGATVNVATAISSGIASGVIPGTAESKGDIRLLPSMTAKDAETALEYGLEVMRAADLNLDVELVVDEDDWPGAAIDPDHPLARAVISAASDVLGRPVRAGGFPGATEAHLLTRRGIATVPAAGPGVLTRAHTPNEWVSTDSVVTAASIYALASFRFLEGVG